MLQRWSPGDATAMSHPAASTRTAVHGVDPRSDLMLRLRSVWVGKMLATSLGIGGFFVAYFWVLNHPQFTVTVMPLIWLDRMVDFRPEALPVYLSLWLYVSIAPALLKTGHELLMYALAAFALATTGLAIFVLFPTTVPEFAIDWSAHASIAFLKTVDVAVNACPSLHVAFALFTAFWLDHLLREMRAGPLLRVLNGLWCVAIAYSTLATRQHVALDVIAGALMGAAFALIHMRVARSLQARRRSVISPAASPGSSRPARLPPAAASRSPTPRG